MCVAGSIAPFGMWNALVEWRLVGTNALLLRSRVVPTLDVAPVSAMADGIVPSQIPAFIRVSLILLTVSSWSSSCSSTWQVGGAWLVNIE
jgi:hypothetical protein